MFRRFVVLASIASLLVVTAAIPASAIIHELVASHCAGGNLPNNDANVDPPGQLNARGNSFARALQASGVYELEFGTDQEGVTGQDFTEDPFDPGLEPLPAPPAGFDAVSVFVDNTRPNAKLGDGDFVWVFFVDPVEELAVYLQLYELDHPAFERCMD